MISRLIRTDRIKYWQAYVVRYSFPSNAPRALFSQRRVKADNKQQTENETERE